MGRVDADFLRGRLKLQHLLVALAVAEEGSTVAAAQRLFISQPSITRAIRELEEILGAPLFVRSASGMQLVEHGGPFLDHVRAALAHLRAGTEHVREAADGLAGRVTIGVHFAGASQLLPRAIIALKHDRPAIEVAVRENVPDALLRLLVQGDVDLMLTRESFALAHVRSAGEDLHFEQLLAESIAVIVAADSRWVGAGPVTLADLAGEQWVLPTPATHLRAELESAFARAGLALPSRTVECAAAATVAQLVTRGGFVAAMPRSAAAALPGIAPLDVTDCRIDSRTGMLWVADRAPRPAARLMAEQLRRAADTRP